MSEDEFDRVGKKFNEYNETIKKLYDWVEEIKWEAGKSELDKIGEKFKNINSNVAGLKSQREATHQRFKSGELDPNQYTTRVGDLVKELSIAESDLHPLMPDFKRFMGSMTIFINEKGITITEEKKKVIDEMKRVLTKFETDTSTIKKVSSELDAKPITINERALSINAYFELNGCALELYTTADDFIKNIIKSPEETRDFLAEVSYNNLSTRFNRVEHFLETYGGYVAKEDEGKIEENIKYLSKTIAEGNAYLPGKNYKECEKKLMDILKAANNLRELSRAKILRLVIELQKVGTLARV